MVVDDGLGWEGNNLSPVVVEYCAELLYPLEGVDVLCVLCGVEVLLDEEYLFGVEDRSDCIDRLYFIGVDVLVDRFIMIAEE